MKQIYCIRKSRVKINVVFKKYQKFLLLNFFFFIKKKSHSLIKINTN